MQVNNTNDQTLDSYNKTVTKYIDTSPQVVDGDLKAWIDKNLDMLGNEPKILEIGSGSGKDADYFASRGFDMELTDASQGFVDHLVKAGKKARLLNVLTDDLGTEYDMVFADAVFLHFNRDQLGLVLNKVHSSLKSGGRLVFSLKAGSGEEVTERKLDVPRYFCFWEADEIEVVLKNAGFSKIDIMPVSDYRGDARPAWLLIGAVKAA
ncbi:MAG TPA: class I SAM-dependent methyltransferase [Candidatus Saccharimonadia bacterium]|nr:class I SAM-dependent methyltransferase [Candidatus Saccharimonadia bacterium]